MIRTIINRVYERIPSGSINLFPGGKQREKGEGAERIFRVIYEGSRRGVGGARDIPCVVLATSVFARRFELTRAS